MFYRNVRILRDPLTVVVKLVPSHEIEVLKYVFDEGSIQILKGWKLTRRPLGTPLDEFHRLELVYGQDPATGLSYVYEAYHNAQKLWKAIPWWVRALDKVLAVKWPTMADIARRFRKTEVRVALIPETQPEAPAFDRLPVEYNTRYGSCDAGMLDAINAALKQQGAHEHERERFKNERSD